MVLRYCAAGVAGVFMQIQRRQSASQRTGLPQAACHQMGLRHFRARQGKTMIRSMLLLMAASSIATPVSAVTLPAAQADVMYNAELYYLNVGVYIDRRRNTYAAARADGGVRGRRCLALFGPLSPASMRLTLPMRIPIRLGVPAAAQAFRGLLSEAAQTCGSGRTHRIAEGALAPSGMASNPSGAKAISARRGTSGVSPVKTTLRIRPARRTHHTCCSGDRAYADAGSALAVGTGENRVKPRVSRRKFTRIEPHARILAPPCRRLRRSPRPEP
jgi:hypothetical protein